MAEKTDILTPEQVREMLEYLSTYPRWKELADGIRTLLAAANARADKADQGLWNATGVIVERCREIAARDLAIVEIQRKATEDFNTHSRLCRQWENASKQQEIYAEELKLTIAGLEAILASTETKRLANFQRVRELEAAATKALKWCGQCGGNGKVAENKYDEAGNMIDVFGVLDCPRCTPLRAALSPPPPPEIPATPSDARGWVSCAERMPEDNVDVLWARVPVEEPYYFGSMCDDDYGGADYYTHWLDPKYIPQPPPPAAGQAAAVPGKMNP